MTWNEFPWFAAASILLWTAGAASALLSKKSFSPWAAWLTATGLCVFAAFIALFWTGLQRPPLRTMGETRLWYSLFLMLAGLLTYCRWHYRWLLSLSTVLTLVFTLMNILKPEIHDQSLMPALQSGWFVPHVTVYIFAYSVMGCAFLLAIAGWVKRTERYRTAIDRLTCIGLAFLTLGMMSGALWAKEAWGHFWGWDPKETWAAATWSLYLIYLHLRLSGKGRASVLNALLVVGFLCLQMCWYGVNYLPGAQESMHVYS